MATVINYWCDVRLGLCNVYEKEEEERLQKVTVSLKCTKQIHGVRNIYPMRIKCKVSCKFNI